jgi:hypothetical protein
MKEMNISDVLLSKFLEGKTDDAEDARLLQAMEAEDLAAIAEAAKLADTAPQQTPNLLLAKKQIEDSLKDKEIVENIPTIQRSKARVYWAVAASIAVLLAVALFFLFRPERSDQNFAQQEKQRVETEVKTENQGSETTDKTELTNNNRKNNMSSNTDAEDTRSESTEPQPAPITSQKLEKNYAATKTANSLTVTKPGKNDYRVLCKNLEKSLQFEWSASNVHNQHFTVTNAQGKVLAELTDKNATHHTISYSKIYPERQLKWTLKVVFEDGTNEVRSGQVQIDYQVQ